jgi:tetratricopeptide (TPR) repeat protein
MITRFIGAQASRAGAAMASRQLVDLVLCAGAPGHVGFFRMEVARTLRAASGWLDLGLADEALYELHGLPPREQGRQRCLAVKLSAQIKLEAWNAASETARLLCLKDPEEAEYFLRAAFCLHETGDTRAACDWLLRGPKSLFKMAEFHYNMGCYLWVLGEGPRAREHIGRALEMDDRLRDFARTDADLKGFGPLP